jgi:hypothetical protein
MGPGAVVASLLGKAQMEMALLCLGTLVRYSADPIDLVLHDDGTLTAADRERLVSELPARVLGRAEADEKMASSLVNLPACRRFRSSNVLALKLLDVAVLGTGSRIAFCDADILFLRPFRNLFEPALGVEAVFQQDLQCAYSVRSWQVAREPRLRLPAAINSGIVVFDRARFDLDLLEWFLAHPDYQRTPAWAEQTAWAVLAGRVNCHLVPPHVVALPGPQAGPDPVALHFVSSLRAGLREVAGRSPDRRGDPPFQIETQPARHAGALTLGWQELRRRVRRLRPAGPGS